jgi:hypothetical protein
MLKYTDIGQFRNVIRAVKYNHDFKGFNECNKAVYFHDTPYPTLKFKGTIKLHGTNTAIIKNTGTYLNWVVTDIYKEENDVIIKNQLNVSKLNKALYKEAKKYWLLYLNSNTF